MWDLLEDDLPHVSAVMLGEKVGYRIFGRVLGRGQVIAPMDLVSVAGDDLELWHAGADQSRLPEFARRHGQAFGADTVARPRRMTIAIVGCSGTGSPLIEQLVRLGVGRIILIDMDHMEWRNVGRIYFSTATDANLERLKVDMLAEAIGARWAWDGSYPACDGCCNAESGACRCLGRSGVRRVGQHGRP